MDITEMILNFSCNILFVGCVLLKTPSIRQSRRVEDVNLRTRSCVLIVFTDLVAHRYAVFT